MLKVSAAFAAAVELVCVAATGLLLMAMPAMAGYDEPWNSKGHALVIDAYEFNPIDWKQLVSDDRIAGFINKASDGLPPDWSCKGKSGDELDLCKNRWWKYSVTKELYMTRRAMAKTLGLKWGAYHLGRPGNPAAQADHFVDFAEPGPDDLIALDIEDRDPDKWMSLEDAETFARQVHIRIGRYPVLYTNGSTAKWIAEHKDKYPLLSRLHLWYARYRDDISKVFPDDNWPSYALWQFSSMHNCTEKECPYRVKGAKTDIDVNVSPLDVAGLRQAWPFNGLIDPVEQQDGPADLIASLGKSAKDALVSVTDSVIDAVKTKEALARQRDDRSDNTMLAAYGPDAHHARIDPLQLLTEVARHEAHERPSPLAAAKPDAARPSVPLPDARPKAKEAEVASLGSFEGLASEMSEVRSVVAEAHARPAPAARSAVASSSGETGGLNRTMNAAVRSKLLQLVHDAEVRKADLIVPLPAYVFSQRAFADGMKGSRLSGDAMAEKASRLASLAPVDRRIAGAFAATR